MTPTIKQPLFIVSGASGVGKSSLCEILFQNETDYIVLESDLLWHDVYNTPENNYRAYRETWLHLCANIGQTGKPIVLCGCVTPDQFEALPERSLFTSIHYLAVVCDDNSLMERMRSGRGISDEGWIESSLQFNGWLKENAEENQIFLLDTSNVSLREAANRLDEWIRATLAISG